jgi:hypothetical protein
LGLARQQGLITNHRRGLTYRASLVIQQPNPTKTNDAPAMIQSVVSTMSMF